MSRCKCCNRILDYSEFKIKNKSTGEHDGLCTKCRNLSYDFSENHEYVLGVLTDSLVHRIELEGSLRVETIPELKEMENTEKLIKRGIKNDK